MSPKPCVDIIDDDPTTQLMDQSSSACDEEVCFIFNRRENAFHCSPTPSYTSSINAADIPLNSTESKFSQHAPNLHSMENKFIEKVQHHSAKKMAPSASLAQRKLSPINLQEKNTQSATPSNTTPPPPPLPSPKFKAATPLKKKIKNVNHLSISTQNPNENTTTIDEGEDMLVQRPFHNDISNACESVFTDRDTSNESSFMPIQSSPLQSGKQTPVSSTLIPSFQKSLNFPFNKYISVNKNTKAVARKKRRTRSSSTSSPGSAPMRTCTTPQSTQNRALAFRPNKHNSHSMTRHSSHASTTPSPSEATTSVRQNFEFDTQLISRNNNSNNSCDNIGHGWSSCMLHPTGTGLLSPFAHLSEPSTRCHTPTESPTTTGYRGVIPFNQNLKNTNMCLNNSEDVNASDVESSQSLCVDSPPAFFDGQLLFLESPQALLHELVPLTEPRVRRGSGDSLTGFSSLPHSPLSCHGRSHIPSNLMRSLSPPAVPENDELDHYQSVDHVVHKNQCIVKPAQESVFQTKYEGHPPTQAQLVNKHKLLPLRPSLKHHHSDSYIVKQCTKKTMTNHNATNITRSMMQRSSRSRRGSIIGATMFQNMHDYVEASSLYASPPALVRQTSCPAFRLPFEAVEASDDVFYDDDEFAYADADDEMQTQHQSENVDRVAKELDLSRAQLLSSSMSSRNSSTATITPLELYNVLMRKHQNSDKIDRVTVVDCRYNYEYSKGHVLGSVNLSTPQALCNYFFMNLVDDIPCRNHVIVLHCEFSSERAPALAKIMRNMDRSINSVAGRVKFPELYILNGGIKAFNREFGTDKQVFIGRYMRMDHPDYHQCLIHEKNHHSLMLAKFNDVSSSYKMHLASALKNGHSNRQPLHLK
eukprot:m.125401 g.125401  ORF g.125401 m.125401 type:complete len:871 (-) comp9428_c0_seq1:146-2758(-)